jgi:magnesium transporter
MDRPIVVEALAHLQNLLEASDLDGAIALIEALRPPDQADVFGELPVPQQQELLPQIDVEDAADILEKMEESEAAELANGLDVSTLAPILDEMQPDEAADLLGDLLPDRVDAALASMSEPEDVQPLLLHADETAGGLMTSEFLALRRRMTADQAVGAIRAWSPAVETAYYLFVVDREEVLCGVVSLRQLIVARSSTSLSDIMNHDVISVRADADQEECARLMSRYDLLALPVVDERQRLLGVITVDDLVEVLEEEATEDIQRLGGMQPLDRPYLDSSVLSVAWKRLGWLALLFVTGTFTGSVMRHFQRELDMMVALAFFVPLLIGTGGNAGSQTTSTVIRSLAIGEIGFGDALHILWHELQAGIILGAMMSVIAFVRAVTWGADTTLAVAVAISIYAIVIWANGLGSLLPLVAARLKVDPTIVSGPAMSTLVDATGLFIYFTVVKLVLGI